MKKNFRSCEKSASQININDMCECMSYNSCALDIIREGKIERENWNLFLLLLSAQIKREDFSI